MYFVVDWFFNFWGCFVLYVVMIIMLFIVKVVKDWNENIVLDWIDDLGFWMLFEVVFLNEEGIDFEICIE